jgi:ubiquinone/menaquinone biosynthesis C-methylase UbiE
VSELQHPDSRSFELVADVYERARPVYPAAAIAWIVERLGLGPGKTVLDLGAGTGKLTRQLVASGAEVIAVEPGDAMRNELLRAVPGVEALRGSAESIPLPDGRVDAMTVGQAFHWFRYDEALPEIRRVLKKEGGIALIWNARDQESELQREVNAFLAPFIPSERAATTDSSRQLAESPLFHGFEERRFRFEQELDANSLVERLGSTSFVAAAAPAERADLERKLRELVERGGGRLMFPYVTAVYVSRAV